MSKEYKDGIFIDLLKNNAEEAKTLINKLIRYKTEWVIPTNAISDEELYISMKSWLKKQPNIDTDSNIQIYRSKARVKQFSQIFQVLDFKNYNKTYLDYGAGRGEISRGIGKFLKLKRPIYMCDVDQWHDEKHLEEKKSDWVFKFIKNNLIPFSQKFDIISSLMVLHHVPDQEKSIKDLCEHLESKGLLIIREHDIDTTVVRNMAHIEHAIHNIVYEDQSFKEFCKDYTGDYKSAVEWKEIFSKQTDWKCVYADTPTGPTKYFYFVMQKN